MVFEFLKKNKDIIIVILITFVALCLRLIVIKNYGSVWFDELYSWDYANQDTILETIFTSIQEDVHLPLYFILLHIWVKIFNDSADCMRYLTLILSLPLFPVIFLAGKNIFNKTTGYLACIFACVSCFCAYYCVEIRFYGLVFLFSLLTAYFNTNLLDKYSKKSSALYITFQTLLNYTFPHGVILFAINFVMGIIYKIKFNKDNLFKTINAYLIALLLSMGAFAINIYNSVALSNSIFSFQKDNFSFSFNIILEILESFFTSSNHAIISQDFNDYTNFAALTDSIQSIILVFIPLIIGTFFLIKGMFTKNKKVILFLIPCLIYSVLIIILGHFRIVTAQTRYFCMAYPIIILCMCYGFSLIKNKLISITIFLIFLQLNILYIFLEPRTVYNLQRPDNADLNYCINDVWKIKKDDLILAPFAGKKMMYYIKNGTFIDFCINEAILEKDKKSGLFYFGDDFYKLNSDNIDDYIIYDALNDIPQKTYEENLKSIFDNMKKGQRLFLIIFFENLVPHPYDRGIDENNYKDTDTMPLVIGKVLRDSILISEKYLNPLENKDNWCSVRVYEKQ